MKTIALILLTATFCLGQSKDTTITVKLNKWEAMVNDEIGKRLEDVTLPLWQNQMFTSNMQIFMLTILSERHIEPERYVSKQPGKEPNEVLITLKK